jgi:hypothetical protein
LLSATAASMSTAIVVGIVTGAVAGTFVVPVFGTLVGGYFGVFVGGALGIIVTPFLDIVLLVRHRRVAEPSVPLIDIARLATVLVIALLGVGVAVVVWFCGESMVAAVWSAIAVGAASITIVIALRRAVGIVAAAWCRPFGWRRHSSSQHRSRRAVAPAVGSQHPVGEGAVGEGERRP